MNHPFFKLLSSVSTTIFLASLVGCAGGSIHEIIQTGDMDLYMTIMFGQSPLRRVHRELLAVVVSKANDCEYCQIHHIEAVKNFWKDTNKTDQLKSNYKKADLTIEEMALCDYAWNLTKDPGNSDKKKYSDQLQKIGFSDRAILDATLVVSYFNFVNRMVLSLGVELEEHPGGYKYD